MRSTLSLEHSSRSRAENSALFWGSAQNEVRVEKGPEARWDMRQLGILSGKAQAQVQEGVRQQVLDPLGAHRSWKWEASNGATRMLEGVRARGGQTARPLRGLSCG